MKHERCGRCFQPIELWNQTSGWVTRDPSPFFHDETNCWGYDFLLHDPNAVSLALNSMGREWAS